MKLVPPIPNERSEHLLVSRAEYDRLKELKEREDWEGVTQFVGPEIIEVLKTRYVMPRPDPYAMFFSQSYSSIWGLPIVIGAERIVR